MKKLIIGMVAIAAIIAFAAPAFAAATVHVRALTDIGWQVKSKELTNSHDTATKMFINLPGHDYLKVLWVSDDKTTGAHVEFQIMEKDNGNNSVVNLRYLYGWYKVGNCRFLAGHSDNWFGSPAYFSMQHVGLTTSAKLLLLGNGTMYASRMPHVRFEWKSNGYGFMIAAVTPGGAVNQWNPVIVDAAGNTVSTPDMASVLPRVDMSFLFRAGGFQTTPGFSWSMQKYQWDDAYDDFEDSVTTWCVFLPARFSMGGLTAKAQFHFGQNYDYEYFHGLGAANANGQPQSVAFPDGDSVENTMMYGGALSFEYRTGALGFFAGGGIMHYQNDLWQDKMGGAEDNYTRYGLYAGMQYNFNKHFYIHPEISYWNYGDPVFPKTDDQDAAYEWLFGAQIGFLF